MQESIVGFQELIPHGNFVPSRTIGRAQCQLRPLIRGIPGAPAPAPTRTRSIALGIVLILLTLLAIFGAVAVILGLGGKSPLDIKLDKFELKTEAVGFGIMALALLGLVGVIRYMPEHITPFGGPARQDLWHRLRPGLAILGGLSLIAAIIWAILDH